MSDTELGALIVYMFIMGFSLFICVLQLIALWFIYKKAGRRGWECLIPFYNNYVLAEMTFGNGWVFLLMLIPCVNFVFMAMMFIRLSQCFGHGIPMGLALIFIPVIPWYMLAFGQSRYLGIPNN